MDDIRSLKALQLDALREVANIGAGHAATALSQMIGGTIMISVPTINVSRLEEVPPQISAPEEPVATYIRRIIQVRSDEPAGRVMRRLRATR